MCVFKVIRHNLCNENIQHCVQDCVLCCWISKQKLTVINGTGSISWNPKHTAESTRSARRIGLENWVPSGGCQEWWAALQGALYSNVKLPWACTHMHSATHTLEFQQLAHTPKKAYWVLFHWSSPPISSYRGRLTKEPAVSSTQRNQTAHLKSTIHRTPLFEGLP